MKELLMALALIALLMLMFFEPAFAENVYLWSNGQPQGMIQQNKDAPSFYLSPDGRVGMMTPQGMVWSSGPDQDLQTGMVLGGLPPMPFLLPPPVMPRPSNHDPFCDPNWRRRGLC